MLLQPSALFWFRAKLALLFLINVAGSEGKKQIPILVLSLTWLQSVPTTTRVVSLNPTHGEVYLMQLYMW